MHGASERALSMPAWERRARNSTASTSSSPAPFPLSSLIAGPSRQTSAPVVSPKSGPRFRTIIHPEHRVDRELRRKLKASKARLISRFDEIADKYGSVAPEDDDELDIIEGKVVHDRGALRALEMREFAEGTDYLAEALEFDDDGVLRRRSEPPIVGPDKILFGDEEDELGDWGERSGLDAQFPPTEIEQDWTPEDVLDLESFLRAEAARRERSGEDQLESYAIPQVPSNSSPSRRLSYLQLDDQDYDDEDGELGESLEEAEVDDNDDDDEDDEGILLSTLDLDRELPPVPRPSRNLPPSSPPIPARHTPSSPLSTGTRQTLSLSRSLPNLNSSLKQPTPRDSFPADTSPHTSLHRSRSVRFSGQLSFIPETTPRDRREDLDRSPAVVFHTVSQPLAASTEAGPSRPMRRASSHLATPAPEMSRRPQLSNTPRRAGMPVQSPTRRWWNAAPAPRETASVSMSSPSIRSEARNPPRTASQLPSSPLKAKDKGKGRAVPLDPDVRRQPPILPPGTRDFPEPSDSVPVQGAEEEPEEERCGTCLAAGGSRAMYARVCRGAGNPRLCPHLVATEPATGGRKNLPPRAPSERLRSQSVTRSTPAPGRSTPVTPRAGARQVSVTPSTASKYSAAALPGYTPEIRWANGGKTKCKRCCELGGERARFAIYCRGRNRPHLCAELANIPVLTAPPDSPILASERGTSMMPSPAPERARSSLQSPGEVRPPPPPFPVVAPPSRPFSVAAAPPRPLPVAAAPPRPLPVAVTPLASVAPATLPPRPPSEPTDGDSDVQYLGSAHGDADWNVSMASEADAEANKHGESHYATKVYDPGDDAGDDDPSDAGFESGHDEDDYTREIGVEQSYLDDAEDDGVDGLDEQHDEYESQATSIDGRRDDADLTVETYADEQLGDDFSPKVPDDTSVSDSASYHPDDTPQDDTSVEDDADEFHDAQQPEDYSDAGSLEREASHLDADASTDSDAGSDLSGSVYAPPIEPEAQHSDEDTASESEDDAWEEADETADESEAEETADETGSDDSDVVEEDRPSWVRIELPHGKRDDEQLLVDENDGIGANYALPLLGDRRYETNLRFTGASPHMEYLQCAECIAAGGERRERAMWCRGRGEVACPFTTPLRTPARVSSTVRATPNKRPVAADDLFSPKHNSATPDESDDFYTPPLGHTDLPDDDAMDLDSSVAADEPTGMLSSPAQALPSSSSTRSKPASVASSDWSPKSSLHSKGSRVPPLPRAATVLPTPPRSESISVSAEPTPKRALVNRPRAATVVATVSRPTPPPSHTPEPQRSAKAHPHRALGAVQEQREPTMEPADTDTLASDMSPRASRVELAVRARDLGLSLSPSPSGRLSSTFLNSLSGVYKHAPGYSLSSSVSGTAYALPSPPPSLRNAQAPSGGEQHARQSTAGLMLPPPVPPWATPQAPPRGTAPSASPQTTPRKRARQPSQEYYDDVEHEPRGAEPPSPGAARYRAHSMLPSGGRGGPRARTQSMSARPSTPSWRDRDTPAPAPAPAPSSTPRKKSRLEREIERAASLATDDDGLEWGLDEDAGYEVARLWREGSVSIPVRRGRQGSVVG